MSDAKKPHVLFINTDQLRPDFLGCYGFPADTSPCIDRLAAEGVRLNGCYTQSPICVPARYSLTTGQYPTNHGAHTNNHAPYPTCPSLVEGFNGAGYHTAVIGKLHHNPPDSAFGFREVLLHDGTFRDRRPLSIYSKFLIEHGLNEDDMGYPADIDATDEKRRLRDRIHWGPCPFEDRFCESTFLSDTALDYVAQYDRDEPLFLYLSYLAPHSPYCPPKPYDEMFDPADMPAPPRESPEQMERKHSSTGEMSRRNYGEGSIPEGTMREIRTQYAGLLRHLDTHVGRAIDAFRARFGQDALIVFTSDHGDLLGEHFRCEKHQMYEAAVRVPYLITWPGHLEPGTSDALVEQIDMFPTVLGLVGGEYSRARTAGRDRSADLLRGEVAGEPYVFSENHDCPMCTYTAMARSREGKLILYLGGAEGVGPHYEYYDLASDPHELENVVDHPAHQSAVHAHHVALYQWMTSTRRFIPPAGRRNR